MREFYKADCEDIQLQDDSSETFEEITRYT